MPITFSHLNFFDEFRELSESTQFAVTSFSHPPVELSNPVCGDKVKVTLELDETDHLIAFAYEQHGCWPVAGCLELLGRCTMGATAAEIMHFSLQDFMALVEGIPASKRHAFSLAHRALRQSLIAEVASRA